MGWEQAYAGKKIAGHKDHRDARDADRCSGPPRSTPRASIELEADEGVPTCNKLNQQTRMVNQGQQAAHTDRVLKKQTVSDLTTRKMNVGPFWGTPNRTDKLHVCCTRSEFTNCEIHSPQFWIWLGRLGFLMVGVENMCNWCVCVCVEIKRKPPSTVHGE